MRYISKQDGNVYTLSELSEAWRKLSEDVRNDYRNGGIYDFEMWLECATDFDGHLVIIE